MRQCPAASPRLCRRYTADGSRAMPAASRDAFPRDFSRVAGRHRAPPRWSANGRGPDHGAMPSRGRSLATSKQTPGACRRAPAFAEVHVSKRLASSHAGQGPACTTEVHCDGSLYNCTHCTIAVFDRILFPRAPKGGTESDRSSTRESAHCQNPTAVGRWLS